MIIIKINGENPPCCRRAHKYFFVRKAVFGLRVVVGQDVGCKEGE
jgi:hypothetical protein